MTQPPNIATQDNPRPVNASMPLRFRGRAIRALLFDLDGTLYAQRRLRWVMGAKLALLPFTGLSPSAARETWKVLRIFRRVREELREVPPGSASLAELQYTAAAEKAGVPPARVQALVERWMYERPLPHLAACRRPGIVELLEFLAARGVPCGVFSDYPVDAKLAYLDLEKGFSIRICATDPDVNAFKPHPQGFLKACALWGFPPADVLYVGDRPEVDARGAGACGMPCAIVGRKSSRNVVAAGEAEHIRVNSFHDLLRELATEVSTPR